MLKNTKSASVILILIFMFGLFGCTTAPADDNWFEESPIINTAYTREYLSQTQIYSTNDIFGAAENWAKEFVSENYKSNSPTGITVGFESGGNTVPSVFTGMDTVFSTMSYYVRFTAQTAPKGLAADANGQYGFHLQMVMKNDGENKLTLLGFVTNQTRQITRPGELAQFLKIVPGYENAQVMKPETENPVEAINLTEKTGGLRIINVVPVGDTLYILGIDPDYRMAGKGTDVTQAEGVLKAFSVENLNLLYEYKLTVDFTKPRSFAADGDNVVFSLDTSDANGYYTAAKTGVTKLEKAPDSASGVYKLSDSVVIRESGSDLLLEKDGKTVPILTGVPYDEQNDNMGESSAYRFRYKVSDTAFVYMKYGYEWIIESGIYDIATGKTTLFSHSDADTLIPVAAGYGRVVLIADTMEKNTSLGPFIYDTASGKTENLNWFGIGTNDTPSPIFGLFGGTLAAFTQENGGFTVRLSDLTDKTDLRTFTVTNYEAAQPSAIYQTEEAYWFTTEAYSLSDLYVFRIPTENK